LRDSDLRPTEREILEWFGGCPDYPLANGIAILCGKSSGGLAVRDFDTMDGYRSWAECHPSFAKLLPTVKTGRGYHVYCRASGRYRRWSSGPGKGEYLPDDGHYVVAPPSYHPGAKRLYEWVVPLSDAQLPDIDPVAAGLSAPPTTCPKRPPQHKTICVRSAPRANEKAVSRIVERCLPAGPGQRNDSLLYFVRELAKVPGFDSAEDLLSCFDAWYQAAHPIICTKGYDRNQQQFLDAWERWQKKRGEFLCDLLADADLIEVPLDVVMEPAQRLFRVCAGLQQANGSEPFFLGCRMAGTLIGVGRQRANELLTEFRAAGYLRREKKGTVRLENGKIIDRQASVWRFSSTPVPQWGE
jgi:hypothetical protein